MSVSEGLGRNGSVEFDNEVLRRIAAYEARNDMHGNVLVIRDEDVGLYGMVEPHDTDDTLSASRTVGALRNHLGGSLDVDNPTGSINAAFEYANQELALAGRETGVAATVLRFYQDENGEAKAAYGMVGNAQVYRDTEKFLGTGRQVEAVTPPPDENASYITGIPESLGGLKTGVTDVDSGDRFVIISDAAERDMSRDIHSRVSDLADGDEAARVIVEQGSTLGDKVALVLDVDHDMYDQRHDVGERTPQQRSSLMQRLAGTGIGATFLSRFGRNRAERGRTTAVRDRQRDSPTAHDASAAGAAGTSVNPQAPGFIERARLRGATVAGSAGNYVRSRSGEIRRRKEARNHNGKPSLYDKANNKLLIGMAALGGRQEKYYLNHWDDDRYNGYTDDNLRRNDLESRRQRKGALLLGSVALGYVAASALKYYGMDIVPTHLKVQFLPGVPRVDFGDGDAVDLAWGHGSSHYHATRLGDPNDKGFWGFFVDDDPARPLRDHTPNAPNVPYPGDNGNNPGAVPGPPPSVWQPETQQVTSASLYTSTIEGILHDMGHHQLGEGHFNGSGAHKAFVDLREYAHQKGFGDDFILINGHDGTYDMQNGDVGLTGDGTMQFVNQDIQNKAHELIAQYAS